jgi:hypothetical protein
MQKDISAGLKQKTYGTEDDYAKYYVGCLYDETVSSGVLDLRGDPRWALAQKLKDYCFAYLRERLYLGMWLY